MKNYKTIFAAFLALVFTASCSMLQQSATPTDTLKKFVEASQKKDVEGMKQSLSSGTLKMMDETAKKQGATLDEALKRDDGASLKEMPETRNEKIEGDTATVEVKNKATSDWDKIPFVKEDGKWKIALDKYMQDLMKRMTEEMKMSDTKTMPMDSKSDNTSSTNSAAANKKP
jgi:hypothetical protein